MYEIKISLQMLYEKLSARCAAEAHIERRERCITDLRLTVPEAGTANRSYVYLCRGSVPGHTLFRHPDGEIEVAAEWVDAANAAMEIFGEFRAIGQRLCSAIVSEQPFQAVAELAGEVFAAPAVITNNSFTVIGITRNAKGSPMDSKGELWEYMKLHGISPPNYVGYFAHPSRFQVYLMAKSPLQQKLPSFCYWKAILRINCFFGGEAKCRLVIQTLDDHTAPGTVQLAECFGEAIEHIPKKLLEPGLHARVLPERFLSESGDLLPGENPLRDAIDRCIHGDDFFLCRMWSLHTAPTVAGAYWLCSCLERVDKASCAWLQGEDVLLLVRATDNIRNELSKKLLPLLRGVGFSCAVSNRCSDLSQLRECLRQLRRLRSIRTQHCPGIIFFSDSAERCLTEELRSRTDMHAWLHPGLRALELADERDKTDHFRTLKCLVKNRFQQTVTADELFIHRNSLQYRVKRIEQLLGCYLSDADTQWYLALSLALYNKSGTPD